MFRALLLVLAVLPATAYAGTYTVAQDGSGDFETINDAIDAAEDGDRVEVAAGTYEEAVNLDGKDIELVGVDGSASTIIEGGGASNALVISAGESSAALVQGFTIHNDGSRAVLIQRADPTFVDVVIEDLEIDYLNGGLFIKDGDPTFTDCVFQDNSGYNGAHVYLSGGTASFTDSTFTGGVASSQGGAIYVDVGALTLDGVTLDDNTATYNGGAISLGTGATLTMTDTLVEDNHTETGNGAGVFTLASNTVTIADSTFYGNYPNEYSSGYSGGGLYMGSGTLDVSNSSFEANYAYYGAGMMLYGTAATFEAVNFSTNYAYYGGGLYIGSNSTLADYGSTFDTNTSYYYGAGIYAYYLFNLTFDGTVFNENAAYYGYGGAVFLTTYGSATFEDAEFTTNYAYYAGGAIYAYDLASDLTVNSSTFTENSATYSHGGAIYAYYLSNVNVSNSEFAYNEAYGSGGAVYTYYYSGLTVTNSDFEYNTATYTSGGAIWHDPYVSGYDLLFVGNTVHGNSSRYEGGGLYTRSGTNTTVQANTFSENVLEDDSFGGGLYASNFGDLTLWGNTIAGNEAIIGAGAYIGSGVDDEASAWVVNNAIADNQANRIGGGLGVTELGGLTLQNNTFVGNQAAQGGGAAYVYETPSEVRNNIFAMTVDGTALAIDGTTAVAYSTIAYNDLWDNPSGNLGGDVSAIPLDATNLELDPLLAGYTLDGDPSDDFYALALGSPCVDAGDPDLSDPDGTRSDMGAFGGPYATLADEDGDGWSTAYDCKDDDATVFPGGSETWYDGVDGDCSGGSDYDQDGDGYDVDWSGGEDCDDLDEAVVACAGQETGDTGGPDSGQGEETGQPDTSGGEDSQAGEGEGEAVDSGQLVTKGGCSCGSAGPRPSSLAPLALALGLLLRRRR